MGSSYWRSDVVSSGLISDGGVCFIVSSAERARDLKKPAVLIAGMGQAHTTMHMWHERWWYVPHQKQALADAFRMAGVGPQDIKVAQLYDNFSISVILWLEHAGFCKEGEAGSRSEERRVGKECVSTCRFRWSPDH